MALQDFKFESTQSHANATTRGQWDWYKQHRQQIERLIVPARRGLRIAVLGAGNCNDLDLAWLSETYHHVRLVDIDPAALVRAVQKHDVTGRANITRAAPVDLTGIAETISAWKGRPVAPAQIDRAIEQVARSASVGDERFDLVLSPCVLSQLLVSVRDVLGSAHAGWPRLKQAIRARHLRDMVRLLAPRGRGVIIVDLSSTSALPGLDQANGNDIPSLMRRAVDDGKCFRGLEPSEMAAALKREGAAAITASPAWIWHLGWGKAFLCYGMSFTAGDRSSVPRC